MYVFHRAAVVAAALALMATPRSAVADTVRLSTGETLIVSCVVVSSDYVEFTHPVLGRLKAPLASVEVVSVGVTPPAERSEPMNAPVSSQAAERAKARARGADRAEAEYDKAQQEAAAKASLDEASFLSGWKGAFSAGANGAQGNTESTSMRVNVDARREASRTDTRIDASYSAAHENGSESRNRGELNALNDWIVPDSVWGYFADAKVEYDAFQDWDWRLSGHAGVTRSIIDDPDQTLKARFGVGASREIGGSRNEIEPEAILSGEWRRKVRDGQSLFVLGEYLPKFSAADDFRFNVKAGYEIVVDPLTGLFLKFGGENRYNSRPGDGFKANDTEYFLLMGFKF